MKKEARNILKSEVKEISNPPEPSGYNNILGLLIFMAFLIIPYIYNSHLTDKKFRKSEKIKKELSELRSEFITLKSEIVGENKQSDIARKLKHRGIEELTESATNLNPDREH